MKKLTYWVAAVKNDAPCYNIRARTKREAEVLRREAGPEQYDEPVKVCVEYCDPLHLLSECLTEGGAIWEPKG